MKVLITGGAGFIGSHVADQLLARGDSVIVIDNFATGRPDHLSKHKHLIVKEGTIADTAFVDDVFATYKPDAVVHTAASYKDPDAWVEDVHTNTLGTVNVVMAAIRNKANRLVYFQTALCYGLKPVEQPITLTHPIDPRGSSYAISKTTAEHYIQLSGLNYVSFRLANIIGPRSYSGPLATFYKRLSEGQPCFVTDTRRDFVYVNDLVAHVLKALSGVGNGPYHVSSGKDFAIKELFDAVVAAMELDPAPEVEVRPRNPDDVYSILLDPSKTIADFGLTVSTPITESVAAAVEQFARQGVAATYTHLKAEG